MRVVAVAAIVCLMGLAGCAEDSAPEPEESFDPVLSEDLKATETTGVIRGVVIDAAIAPVEGATIAIQNGPSTTSNANGAFGFDGLEPGTYFLQVSKEGYETIQVSAEVVAGVDLPPVVKVALVIVPGLQPYVVVSQLAGFLACGVAVFATSIGCTILGPLADLTESTSIWRHEFDSDRVQWTQGELVWEQTQPAGGMFIWEITNPGTNQFIGHRETTTSPALAFVNTTILQANENDILTEGVDYRFFGGPHELCRLPEPIPRPPEAIVWYTFGCGVTLDQAAEAFVHDFYNFTPVEGWRFTADGDPTPPS